jgi:Uma2 family endonuclease
MGAMTSQHELRDVLLALLPVQGGWAEEDYLWLSEKTNRPLEFTDGYIEVLPMPTSKHQASLRVLFLAFFGYLQPRGGNVLFAPLCLRLRPGKFREPDLLALLDANDPRYRDRYWLGADLVAEVVSADNPERDLIEKRREYAEAGIPEYWIANPLDETIAVLRLQEGVYVEHGVFARGERATSTLLPGFGVEVDAVFDAK